MSNIHLIITQERHDFLAKSRFLKFCEYVVLDNCFAYIRYDYHHTVILKSDNHTYQVSGDVKNMFEKLLALCNDGFYWTTLILGNGIRE